MKVAMYIPFIPDENTTPALGPLYILAVLQKNGYNVRLFDARLEKNALKDLLLFKPEVVGISAVTPGYNDGLKAARAVRVSCPSAKIVFGGPHASALPEEVIEDPSVDFVFRGESELPFLDLCRIIEKNDCSPEFLLKVSNLFYKDGQTVRSTGIRELLSGKELDELPYPAFGSMNIDAYFANTQAHGLFRRGKRILPVMSSRGCPSNCTFCCRVMGSRIRERSVGSVISEIRYLIDTYRVDEIYFEDDNFTVNKPRALEILEKIAALKPKIYLKFANGIRADRVDEELLGAMRKAGVYSISFGIESGSPSTLKKMRKNLDLEEAKKNVLLAKSMGFFVGGNCIVGYPGEMAQDINDSVKYFLSLPLDSMAIVNLVPFPGTEARKECERYGYLTPEAKNWDNYYFSINNPIPLIETPQISKEELAKNIRKIYRKMYLRPKWIMNSIKHLSIGQVIKGASKLLLKN